MPSIRPITLLISYLAQAYFSACSLGCFDDTKPMSETMLGAIRRVCELATVFPGNTSEMEERGRLDGRHVEGVRHWSLLSPLGKFVTNGVDGIKDRLMGHIAQN